MPQAHLIGASSATLRRMASTPKRSSVKSHGELGRNILCEDCGCDISSRHHSAERCKPCALARTRSKQRARYAEHVDEERARSKAYREANVERERARGRAKRAAQDPEARRAYETAWRAANPDRCREYQQRYYDANADSVRHKARLAMRVRWHENREHVLAQARLRRLVCPEIGKARHARRRARKLAAVHEPWTTEEWQWTLDQFGGLCAYCRERPGSTIDHVVPLARGGADAIWNLLPACVRCNCSKGPRTLAEWTDRPYSR